ncbi:hypothetical protein HDF26_001162 [Pedobacter cryoconitis]|uniref:hypothetical protein n=1 Tax=Pedobacter cryoconitis TaxID=188932 RepID=UPI00160A89AA|nr:hypothetical protein [Pedobacter cryoconitis]MBB6270735.1 hypothetical protein [Pedobacter cryoconitis]
METRVKKDVRSEAELRSSGVQNLLNKLPHWLILKGNLLISVMLIIFIVFIGYYVKYPEFINSKITITPQNNSIKSKQPIMGLLVVSKNNLEKIKAGQKTIIKLYDYSFQEFGVLVGEVQNIIPTPDEKNIFYVHVVFPEGLKTSYNKTILINKELKGDAEIIVQDTSWLFGSVK